MSNVDRRHKLVKRYPVSDAPKHDIDDILDRNKGFPSGVWADSSCCSAEIEAVSEPDEIQRAGSIASEQAAPFGAERSALCRGNKTRWTASCPRQDACPAGPRATPLGAAVVSRVIAKTKRETPPDATHWSLRTMAKAVGIVILPP